PDAARLNRPVFLYAKALAELKVIGPGKDSNLRNAGGSADGQVPVLGFVQVLDFSLAELAQVGQAARGQRGGAGPVQCGKKDRDEDGDDADDDEKFDERKREAVLFAHKTLPQMMCVREAV